MVLTRSKMDALKQGADIPEFSLRNVDGKIVRLSDFKGKPLVVVFMCNHCPFVKAKLDDLVQIQKDYENQVPLIAISANDATQYPEDSFANMQMLALERGINYYLYDETQDVAVAFGAVCTPDVFAFDADHKLVYHGRINNALNPGDVATKEDLKEVLHGLTTGKPIIDWFRPSIGCSIKWRSDTTYHEDVSSAREQV